MNPLRYASTAEILQLVIAMTGFLIGQRELWRNVINGLELTHTGPDDTRRLVAIKNVTVEMILELAQGMLVVVGIVSVLLPPPNTADPEISDELLQAVLVRVGLMLVTVLLTAVAYVKAWLDKRFYNMVLSKADMEAQRA